MPLGLINEGPAFTIIVPKFAFEFMLIGMSKVLPPPLILIDPNAE